MRSLGLIGRNIQHSKSKDVYELILKEEVDYHLFDYNSQAEIPSFTSILNKVPSISITAPYKKYAFEQIDKYVGDFNLNTVNAIKIKNSIVYGTNTDAIAFLKIFNKLFNKFDNVYILGDGAMSDMICALLKDSVNLQVLSRKNKKISNSQYYSLTDKVLLINTCSRSFNFTFNLKNNYYFWDMNYEMPEHRSHFLKMNVAYLDGYSLLIEQAKFALSFWN